MKLLSNLPVAVGILFKGYRCLPYGHRQFDSQILSSIIPRTIGACGHSVLDTHKSFYTTDPILRKASLMFCWVTCLPITLTVALTSCFHAVAQTPKPRPVTDLMSTEKVNSS